MQELGGAQESGRRPPWHAGRAATRGGLGRPCDDGQVQVPASSGRKKRRRLHRAIMSTGLQGESEVLRHAYYGPSRYI